MAVAASLVARGVDADPGRRPRLTVVDEDVVGSRSCRRPRFEAAEGNVTYSPPAVQAGQSASSFPSPPALSTLTRRLPRLAVVTKTSS